MSKILKNMNEMKNEDLSYKTIKLLDASNNTIEEIEPVAIENCMNPGTFDIKPVCIKEEKGSLFFDNGNAHIFLWEKDLENGIVKVQIDEFVPKAKKAKSQCTSCTNCGRCSW